MLFRSHRARRPRRTRCGGCGPVRAGTRHKWESKTPPGGGPEQPRAAERRHKGELSESNISSEPPTLCRAGSPGGSVNSRSVSRRRWSVRRIRWFPPRSLRYTGIRGRIPSPGSHRWFPGWPLDVPRRFAPVRRWHRGLVAEWREGLGRMRWRQNAVARRSLTRGRVPLG